MRVNPHARDGDRPYPNDDQRQQADLDPDVTHARDQQNGQGTVHGCRKPGMPAWTSQAGAGEHRGTRVGRELEGADGCTAARDSKRPDQCRSRVAGQPEHDEDQEGDRQQDGGIAGIDDEVGNRHRSYSSSPPKDAVRFGYDRPIAAASRGRQ